MASRPSPLDQCHPQHLTIALVQADPTHDMFICGRSLNDSGIVAYSRCGIDVPVQGVYTSDGVNTTTITEHLLGQPFEYNFTFTVGEPQINNDGTVVFEAVKSGHPGLFAAKNGQITTLLTKPFGHPGPQRLNDTGEVVFHDVRSSDNAEGLFGINVSGGPVTPIVLNKDLGPNVTIGDQFSVNNNGRVAFSVQDNDLPFTRYVATSDGGPIKIIATSTSDGISAVQAGGNPSINDGGEIAFMAAYKRNGQFFSGIFMGSDPQHDRIIGGGDPFFGSTATGVAFDSNGLNDLGQIAFIYGLADGTGGIAIATLKNVPEPSETSVLCAIVAMLAHRKRRDTGTATK